MFSRATVRVKEMKVGQSVLNFHKIYDNPAMIVADAFPGADRIISVTLRSADGKAVLNTTDLYIIFYPYSVYFFLCFCL